MPNKSRSSYEIKIGESEYVLRPTFEAIMEFQDKSGIGIFQGMTCLEGKPDVKVVTAAIWAGVKGEYIFQGDAMSAPSFNQIGAEIMSFGVTKVLFDAYAFLKRCACADDEKKSTEEYLEKIRELALETQTENPTGGDSQAS